MTTVRLVIYNRDIKQMGDLDMTEYQQHVTEIYNHVIPDQDKNSYGYQDRRRWFMSHEDTISLHQWACATYEGDDWDGLQVLIDNWLAYQEKCVELAD